MGHFGLENESSGRGLLARKQLLANTPWELRKPEKALPLAEDVLEK